MMAEWWKQLYGERGQKPEGLFPASVIFSTDLHSMGQFIQDGKRNLMETVVLFDKAKYRSLPSRRTHKCGRPQFPDREDDGLRQQEGF